MATEKAMKKMEEENTMVFLLFILKVFICNDKSSKN
jgi:hypothetical protein